ncbi:neuraminidase [Opitutaceae bacterium TAV5]|nr:neuraminidase [Opitutaceae bacterium TAV5]
MPATATHPTLRAEFIFETAPTPSCHASTLAETPHGLVAAWFGGKRECFPDVGIWLARLDAATGQWTEPVEVANGIQHTTEDGQVLRYACWNPVLFQPRHTPGAPLVLFYKVGKTPQTWWGMMTTSADGGHTWASHRRLPEGICGPVKNKPVELPDGTWLCPASTEESVTTGWRVHFERTADAGRTWTRTAPVNDGIDYGAIQPSILRHDGGRRLQAIGRTQLVKRLFSTDSLDAGRTWSEIAFLDVPNPDSGTDAVTLADGRHALICNPTESGRSPLSLALSSDGLRWTRVLDLETGPGEYSYPAIIQTADGHLHMTWTWKRERIKHAAIDPSGLVG